MMRLVTLGTTDLRAADGTALGSVLRQPRRFGLLVFLALESRRGMVRRDRILSVFWPEVSQEQGRRSLSQALHYLRRSLGPEAVQTRGAEDLQLDLDALSCDACAFLDRIDAGEPEAALRLYAGDFLPAFYGGVPDFDDWLDRTRDALRRAAAEAAWAAAAGARERQLWVAAGAHARRAADLTGGDEPAVRRLMEFLATVGDRGGALEAYDALTARLARDYEAAPDPVTRALALRVRAVEEATAHAPVLLAEEFAVSPTVAPEPAPVTAQFESRPADELGATGGVRLRARGMLRSAVVTVALTAGFISLWGLTRGGSEAEADVARPGLLVENVRGQSAVAEPLTGEVVRLLADARGVRVLLDGAPFEDEAAAPVFLVRTALQQAGDSLQATVGLADRASGTAVASARMSVGGAAPDALAELAERIAHFVRRSAGAELERRSAALARVSAPALAAWERARHDLADADSLRQAGLLDAARVRLHAADSLLALAEREAGDWVQVPAARAELERVRMWLKLSEGSGWGPARATLARGIEHAARGVAIAPQDARSLELRGVLRTLLWLSTPADSVRYVDAQVATAHADLELATRLSPGAARAWQYLSMILFARGDYARAYHAADNALAADAFLEDGVGVRTQLFWSALEVGDSAAARRGCEELERQRAGWQGSYCQLVLLAWADAPPADSMRIRQLVGAAQRDPHAERNRGALDAVQAVLLARRGDAEGARQLLDAVLSRSAAQPELLYHAAWVHMALDEPDRARALLDRFVAGWPAARAGVLRSRRFATLSG